MSNTIGVLVERSRILAERIEAGQAAFVGLCYRLADGRAEAVAAHGIEIAAARAA